MRGIFCVSMLCACALAVSGLAGCGKAAEKATDKAAEKVAEKAAERALKSSGGGGRVDIDNKTGAVRVTGRDASGASYDIKSGASGDSVQMTQTTEEGTVTAQYGEGAKLPADFPKDVPVLDGLKIEAAVANGDKGEFTVSGKTTAGMDDVLSFYKDKTTAQGWKETMSMNAGEMYTFMCEKDSRALSVMMVKEEDGTMVSLSVTPK
ncbi:MAG: hypothetical protein GX580_06960 [Candidatus Hydrogenedens sp.]|nr:hypothetical protein [Candidatus Hydrogenedentota bacterium]NLF57358.1 hypothetical protein [Candidatus Hydrogenedens sp.]